MPKHLIIDGVKFMLWSPQSELNDFQPIIREHAKEIFGPNSLYIDITPELRSNAGIGSKPDGLVIVFERNPVLYIIEVEKAEHGVHDHVVTQISKFNSAFKKPETKQKIVKLLYEYINKNPDNKIFFQSKSIDEPYKFLTEIVSKQPTVVIIIDKILDELLEAIDELPLTAEVLEFQTFKRIDANTVHAHLFDSMNETDIERKKDENPKHEYPEHRTSYDALLEWVDPKTKAIANELSAEIQKLPNVAIAAHGRNLCFYKGNPRTKSVFAAYILNQGAVCVRIRTEATILNDPKDWTGNKVFNGWFFKANQEKMFRINNNAELDYAMNLIKQSYDLAELGR